ncbi:MULTISPECIES: phage major capsid protein, P2 family [Stenotrophomonas]|uniref:Phage major capsid protein, P2 family n=2 Tax=Gammaproteobacteria TaxID=1236 RepID=A0ABM7R461_9GAMM|nr:MULTISPECIES: phage major capsid protein, P2 family [Stenotrophomonas]MBN4941614.1 phage major capsid protein, P2 family [Stenotrophomonas maltophilia]MBN5058135.1 phage major capsid protein, P2 family [Stenotrophomonas maltophilia]MBN5066841.1 phage major capsid protein, P2 family [Stenotrophomonas maltophilia]MDH1660045.1 phage major capsid protein, P2 family [Stenotrophomonas sp. GD03777]BCX45076.1 phage major capsid protein, P2 family [Stenotrophomonas pavanii]
MRTETRRLFEGYTQQVATLNNVSGVANTFSVEPTVQQSLEARMQESSTFLQAINMVGVNELKGQKVGVGITGTIAGRTDTSGNGERNPSDPTSLVSNTYECQKTDFDTALPYARLDAWAHRPEFQTLIRDAIIQRQALDRIMIGWHGTSIAINTDRVANPMLQDVNKGWLQKYREHAPERVMTEGVDGSGKIKVGGTGADYGNIDALVMDLVANMIDPWHQEDPSLVVICGRQLVHDKYFPIINRDNAPTEKVAAELILGAKRIGGLQPVIVPFFPAKSLMVTSLSNLSLYWQIASRRRHIIEQPNKNRVANFESSNDDYVVEDYGLGAVAENIEFGI